MAQLFDLCGRSMAEGCGTEARVELAGSVPRSVEEKDEKSEKDGGRWSENYCVGCE